MAARLELLQGLRTAALQGTAKALGRRGYWAKTGTVGRPGIPRTVGWAIAVEDSGSMSGGESLGKLHTEADDFLFGQGARLEPLIEGVAGDEFGNKKIGAVEFVEIGFNGMTGDFEQKFSRERITVGVQTR